MREQQEKCRELGAFIIQAGSSTPNQIFINRNIPPRFLTTPCVKEIINHYKNSSNPIEQDKYKIMLGALAYYANARSYQASYESIESQVLSIFTFNKSLIYNSFRSFVYFAQKLFNSSSTRQSNPQSFHREMMNKSWNKAYKNYCKNSLHNDVKLRYEQIQNEEKTSEEIYDKADYILKSSELKYNPTKTKVITGVLAAITVGIATPIALGGITILSVCIAVSAAIFAGIQCYKFANVTEHLNNYKKKPNNRAVNGERVDLAQLSQQQSYNLAQTFHDSSKQQSCKSQDKISTGSTTASANILILERANTFKTTRDFWQNNISENERKNDQNFGKLVSQKKTQSKYISK